ncbi:MAG: 50S ribosomal protein L3 [Candidatus Berkelbacteria bacterium]
MKFALGKKIGMTRIFDETGRSFAVTMIKSLNCKVAQIKSTAKDGYNAIQIAATEKKGEREKTLKTCEFRTEDIKSYKRGKTISFEQFAKDEKINVVGVSKGKGFAGTIKRHHFSRGPEGHGSNNVREPGSIGAQQPQRVIPGKKMPGHMGAENVTVRNLKIADLDGEIMLIAGAVPGNNKSYIKIYSFGDIPADAEPEVIVTEVEAEADTVEEAVVEPEVAAETEETK